MKYTYKQISEITGRKVENLRGLVSKLGIKRYMVSGVTKIDRQGLEIIEAHLAPKISKTNNKYKIRIIEKYLETDSIREVSRSCKISRITARKIIDEWKTTGHITVDSCMNFPEKQQNKGIFYRCRNWGYSFMKAGKRYYKRGFETEAEAVEALYLLKERLNNE